MNITLRKAGALLLSMLGFNAVVAIADDSVSATVVWYLEQEAGTDAYRTRYIVTDEYLRADGGDDSGSFALFDRKQKQIYNVVVENNTVLHIDAASEAARQADGFSFRVKESVDPQAPKVEGKAPLTVELSADLSVCYSAVVVPGLLEQARLAFAEFSKALTVRQMQTLEQTPAEFQTPCFLARYIYVSDFHLSRGMPLLEWAPDGSRRELIDYQNEVVFDASVFSVPENVKEYRLN